MILLDSLSLFDGDFPTKLQKNILVKDLKSIIPESEMIFSKISGVNKMPNFDFMSIIRWLSLQ